MERTGSLSPSARSIRIINNPRPSGEGRGVTGTYLGARRNRRQINYYRRRQVLSRLFHGGREWYPPRGDVSVAGRVLYERSNGVWSRRRGEGGGFKGLPHTPTSVNQTRNPPRNALRTSKHRNALWWSVLEPDLYKCITAPWKPEGEGEGEGGTRDQRGKNAIYSYSIGLPGPFAARDSRYLIEQNARTSTPPSIFIILAYNRSPSNLSYRPIREDSSSNEYLFDTPSGVCFKR